MKLKSIFFIAIAFCFFSCGIQDIPDVSVNEKEYIVDSNGGNITIPVTSTGIDDVTIILRYNDRWNIDPSNGDRTPKEPWISVSQIIENYPQTKELPSWNSGVVLKIEANESADRREATVQFKSFNKTADIKVIQAGRSIQ